MADTNPYFVSPNQNPFSIAQKLLRAEFENWQAFFKPIELMAINQLSFNNPNILPEAERSAEKATTESFNTMQESLDIMNRSMGIKPTEQQKASTERQLNIDKALAVTGNVNQARQNVRRMDEMILLGGVPNMNVVKPTVMEA